MRYLLHIRPRFIDLCLGILCDLEVLGGGLEKPWDVKVSLIGTKESLSVGSKLWRSIATDINIYN